MAPREERVWEETGAPPRRLEPQERGVRSCGPVARPHTPNLVSKQLQRWNPPLGPREEALLYPTYSPSAPLKLKAGHPSLPPTGELKSQGLAWSRSVYRVYILLFHRWQATAAQRGACWSHTATQGGELHQDRRRASGPSPALGTSQHSHGASWQETRPLSPLSLNVESFPQPQAGEVTTRPQARAGAQSQLQKGHP